jgi:tRNA pseudouridine55 synthase
MGRTDIPTDGGTASRTVEDALAAHLAAGAVLPVDKPAGPTSHDVVAVARRALRLRRIGHTGTLDPFASGLLILCLGPATRLAEYLTPLPKRYLATMRLGETTDTDDPTGEVVARNEAWRTLDPDRIRSALAAQVGEILQVPSTYSAKKVGGVRAYAAARAGAPVELQPVRVAVHAIEVVEIRDADVVFEVECSSGTYIRAIARDVGAALGVGAHLRELRRLASGSLDVARAVPLDRLDDTDAVVQALVDPAAAVAHLPRLTLSEADVSAVRQGRAADGVEGVASGTVALLDGAGALVAIAEVDGSAARPRKVFA